MVRPCYNQDVRPHPANCSIDVLVDGGVDAAVPLRPSLKDLLDSLFGAVGYSVVALARHHMQYRLLYSVNSHPPPFRITKPYIQPGGNVSL